MALPRLMKKIAALKCELKNDIKSVREELNEATKSTQLGKGSLRHKKKKTKQNSTTATRQHRRRECEIKGGI